VQQLQAPKNLLITGMDEKWDNIWVSQSSWCNFSSQASWLASYSTDLAHIFKVSRITLAATTRQGSSGAYGEHSMPSASSTFKQGEEGSFCVSASSHFQPPKAVSWHVTDYR